MTVASIRKSPDPAADASVPSPISAALQPNALDALNTSDPGTADLESIKQPNVDARAASQDNTLADSTGGKVPLFDTAPSPAPPSFISKLGKGVEGAVGLADPDSKDPSVRTGQRVGNLISRVAGAGVLAGGNEAQKESTLNQEKIQAEMPLKLASLASLDKYRLGRVDASNTANDIKQQQADTAQQKAEGTMRLKGYVPDEKNPGAFRSMNEDEVLSDPVLSRNQELASAAIVAKQAQADKLKADADVVMNPNNPTFRQKQKEIDAKLALAKAHFALQQHQVSNSDAHLALARYQSRINTGADDTGQTLTPQNAPPFMAATSDGQPIPYKSPFSPTAQIRNVQAQAAMAVDGIPGVQKELMDLHDQIGPLSGRWGEFMQGKVGMDNLAFAGLRSDLLMLSSAVALAHARGRLPENLREEFDRAINAPQQTADNLLSVISHIEPWMKRASEMAAPIPANVKRGTGTPAASTPQSNAKDPLGIR